MKLLQRLRITIISARFGFAFRTHGRHTQSCHVVTDFRTFTGRVGDIYIVIEDSHGKRQLGKFPVVHDNIWLEPSVFGRTHTWEVNAIFCLPIMLLQVTEMIGQHGYIRAPFFQSD